MRRSGWSSDLWPLLRAVAAGAVVLLGVGAVISFGSAALELVAMR
jgi:hypothetical protein